MADAQNLDEGDSKNLNAEDEKGALEPDGIADRGKQLEGKQEIPPSQENEEQKVEETLPEETEGQAEPEEIAGANETGDLERNKEQPEEEQPEAEVEQPSYREPADPAEHVEPVFSEQEQDPEAVNDRSGLGGDMTEDAVDPPIHPVQVAQPAVGSGVPGVSIRNYLDSTVIPVLRLGLRELVKQRPQDPFDFLSNFIKENKPK
ncbi:hypothetical protein CEUSTIGMA_g12138.t1 [Chlamydomonas eustigma]|uniref:Uncharacterized protein n=1 Tax=Chlamydomonas eustigma TaxID=1157962 RepID=A0A250XNX0_9CHLO|nr:hypothetical protein CEUSTIGMA_g12138.t1 [Chlamydomonas eustigma]|eukprot:GAX84716.1 hypothetical protein CEUSTIGMA_g12138.t1 [Chlamydomonas eustigma]